MHSGTGVGYGYLSRVGLINFKILEYGDVYLNVKQGYGDTTYEIY